MNKYPPINRPVKAFKHQDEALYGSWDSEFYALLMEMGTGKSKVAIDTMCGLAHTGQIDGALILAPKGAYLNWSKNELPKHMSPDVDYYVGIWSASMNRKEEALVRNVIAPVDGHLDILVMNIEALNSDRAMMFAIEFLEHHNAITIIDESDCIKNPQASRTKKAFTIGKLSKFRRIMTGTPITHSPLDLFAQFQFLKPGCLKFTSFTAFRSFYAHMVLMKYGPRAFMAIATDNQGRKMFRNLDTLQHDVQAFSYRKLKSECLDLPPKIYSTRYIEMTAEQRAIYTKFKEEALIEFSGGMVTSTSALTTLMRLQQIACGHVRTDAGVTVPIENNRIDALIEIIEQAPGKVIIWCNFQDDVRIVVNKLSELQPFSAVSYYGNTSDADRADALARFKDDPSCLYFCGTPGTGGRSLTLVESDTTVYYSNGHKLGDRMQSEDRNHRIGQTRTVNIIDIVCEDTVDEKIVKCLHLKQEVAELILNNWQDLLI